jgi:hypothetical protein
MGGHGRDTGVRHAALALAQGSPTPRTQDEHTQRLGEVCPPPALPAGPSPCASARRGPSTPRSLEPPPASGDESEEGKLSLTATKQNTAHLFRWVTYGSSVASLTDWPGSWETGPPVSIRLQRHQEARHRARAASVYHDSTTSQAQATQSCPGPGVYMGGVWCYPHRHTRSGADAPGDKATSRCADR